MTESITELPPLEERPLVTFALFAYNQEKYIREAVEGAFAQTYEPLEIILSDDCSADRTFEIMKEMAAEYRGPHRIILNRNIQNLNIGGHVNKVSNLANGDLVVLAAGDDISVSIRTEKLFNFWDSRGRPTAVLCSDFMPINNFSKTVLLSNESTYFGPFDIISMARGYVRILGATTAFSRNIFTAFAPMNASVIHEDKVLPFRALLLGGTISAMTDKLVYYRVTGGISRTHKSSGKDYLLQQVPKMATRMLPDAVQRLSDLNSISTPNMELEKACKSAISDQRARIELNKIKVIEYELWLIKWTLKRAKFLDLFKIYLKLRFVIIFNYYYKIRFSA